MTFDLTLPLIWVSVLLAYWLGKCQGRRERTPCQCRTVTRIQPHVFMVRAVEEGVVQRVTQVAPGEN